MLDKSIDRQFEPYVNKYQIQYRLYGWMNDWKLSKYKHTRVNSMIYRNMHTNISENTLKANIEQSTIAF